MTPALKALEQRLAYAKKHKLKLLEFITAEFIRIEKKKEASRG